MVVVVQAVKLRPGDEKLFAQSDRRPRLSNGDEPVEELKVRRRRP